MLNHVLVVRGPPGATPRDVEAMAISNCMIVAIADVHICKSCGNVTFKIHTE